MTQDFNPEEKRDPQEPSGSFLKNLHPYTYVAIVLFIIFFLYQFLGAALVLASGGLDGEESNVKISRIVLVFGQFMFILAPTIFFARFQTSDLKTTFRFKVPKPSLLFLAIIGIILIQPFLQGYLYFQDVAINSLPGLRDFVKPVKDMWDALEGTMMKIVTAYSPFEFAVVIFVICLTPAICEEFLFRGFVLTNLLKRQTKTNTIPGTAIFLSGFLFALYHFQPFNLIPLVILGWYLGFIVYYSNSILTGVICHFINNFLAAYFLYAYGKENFDNPNLTDSEVTNALIAAIISFILFSVVIVFFYRFKERGIIE